MPDDKESMATKAARRALEFADNMKERIDEELRAGIGYKQVAERRINNLIRSAVNDDKAMAELRRLAQLNGHSDGEPNSCAVCERIDAVWEELQNAESGNNR